MALILIPYSRQKDNQGLMILIELVTFLLLHNMMLG